MKFLTRLKTSVYIVLSVALAIASKFLPLNIGDYIFDIFILAVVIVSAFETCNIFEGMGKKINKFLATMYGIFMYAFILIAMHNFHINTIIWFLLLSLLIYGLLIFVVESILFKTNTVKENFVTTINTLLACIYPTFWFMLMLVINHIDLFSGVQFSSIAFILLIISITMLTDTFAYLVGSRLRGPKLAPKISPNKTISGAIGGLIGGIVGAMLVFAIIANAEIFQPILSMYNLAWWHFLLIGFFGSIIGQVGDLFESLLKRKAKMSDSGNIFPGHGGMLDRIDAMTFVTAFIFVIVFIILI